MFIVNGSKSQEKFQVLNQKSFDGMHCNRNETLHYDSYSSQLGRNRFKYFVIFDEIQSIFF